MLLFEKSGVLLPRVAVKEGPLSTKLLESVATGSMEANGVKVKALITSRGGHVLRFWGTKLELHEVVAHVPPENDLFAPLDLIGGRPISRKFSGWRYEFKASQASRALYVDALRDTVKLSGPMKTRLDLRCKPGDKALVNEVGVMGNELATGKGVLVRTFRLYPDNALICTETTLVRQ